MLIFRLGDSILIGFVEVLFKLIVSLFFFLPLFFSNFPLCSISPPNDTVFLCIIGIAVFSVCFLIVIMSESEFVFSKELAFL